MLHVWDKQNPMAALSLEAENAFDRVERQYLFLTLKAFGFGDNFKWICPLYTEPKTAVLTNGYISSYFNLE